MAMNWMPQMSAATRKRKLPEPAFLGFMQNGGGQPFQATGSLGYTPSAQRLRQMAPSELAGYGGWLEDEKGLHAPDVFWQSQRMAPRSLFQRAPKWIGGF